MFCIFYDNAPFSSEYYSANNTVPTPAELRIFEEEKINTMRKLAIQEQSSIAGEKYYSLGEKMKSCIQTTPDEEGRMCRELKS